MVAIDNHSSVFPADDMGNQTSDVPISITDNTNINSWLYGLYLQDEWHPLAPLTVNVGIRYDLNDAFVHADQFSPRLGLVYELPTQTTLHGGYARYFTPPPTELVSSTDVQKFNNTTGALPSSQSSPVQPERADYFDAGVIQHLGSAFNIGVDGYFKNARNELDEGQFGAALVFTPFNYLWGRVYGTEATASYTQGNLSAYVNFAYSVAQGTKVNSGQFNFSQDDLAYISNHYIFLDHDQTFTSSGGLFYGWHGYGFRFDYLYGSGLRTDSNVPNGGNLPFYIQANAGISKRFAVPYLGWAEARVDCINLGDETYLIRNGSGVGVESNQYGPRRAVYAGIRVPLPFGNTSADLAPAAGG